MQDYSDSLFDFLSPELLIKLSPKRKIEFAAGRFCAYKAFEMNEVFNCNEIGVCSDRSPDWPLGWVGSITHTGGFASAVVARSETIRSIGIDSEHIMGSEVVREVMETILLPTELALWKTHLHSQLDFNTYVTLIFSAKESAYKCLNPILGVFFDFQEIEILFVDLKAGTFSFRILKMFTDYDYLKKAIIGKFVIFEPLIHSSVEIEA
jgi:enterobactin synthetase component D